MSVKRVTDRDGIIMLLTDFPDGVKARGARYAEMLRLSAEYEAIPEIARREDARRRRSWWWWRIDASTKNIIRVYKNQVEFGIICCLFQ
jgi:hypothetical protein